MVIPTEQKTLPIDRVVRQKPDKPQRKKNKATRCARAQYT